VARYYFLVLVLAIKILRLRMPVARNMEQMNMVGGVKGFNLLNSLMWQTHSLLDA